MSLEYTPDEPVFIKSVKIDDSVVDFKIDFGKKLKNSIQMKVSDDFLLSLLCYVENYFASETYSTYDGIRFEDINDSSKSFNLILDQCNMEIFNKAYGLTKAEHEGALTIRWRKTEGKRDSHTETNNPKKRLVSELYNFIRFCNENIQSQLIESLLNADLYEYYNQIRETK